MVAIEEAPNGNVDLSLANALRLRRPIVVMDEAHNARTPTSFESLARFGPSFVLELTATPEQRHDPQHPTEPRFASNVLYAASALELQREGMIKLPVDHRPRVLIVADFPPDPSSGSGWRLYFPSS